MKTAALVVMWFVGCSMAMAADFGKATPLTDAEWRQVDRKLTLLNAISHIPSLLPVIMRNRDSLELTQQQLQAFREWRHTYYQTMVDTMNLILEKRIQLGKAAMDPAISGDALLAMQQDIFALQRDLLRIRLGCRRLVMESFTDDQWEAFAFVVAEDAQLAGLVRY